MRLLSKEETPHIFVCRWHYQGAGQDGETVCKSNGIDEFLAEQTITCQITCSVEQRDNGLDGTHGVTILCQGDSVPDVQTLIGVIPPADSRTLVRDPAIVL